ncbi:MAG TPA: alpha/beta fold hydrolase [Acidobacteriota bacterium]|jgi:hypothetical protein|nr:alpha/beta fold hydrolase [Acidobacteriota bacterium]
MADLGKIENLYLPSAAGRLEVLWKHQSHHTGRFAVICHPHPLHGGTMHNKVVFHAAKAFFDGKFDVVRFNFRGVGASTGSFDGGDGEQEDLRVVLQEIIRRNSDAKVVLCGYSFGAYVSAKTAMLDPAAALVLIAPPSKHYSFDCLKNSKLTTAVVFAELDEFAEVDLPKRMIRWLQAPHLTLALPTDHSFQSQLENLQKLLSAAVVPFIQFCLQK